MSKDDKKRMDPELEKFLRENKEMVMRLLREEKEMAEDLLKEEKEFFKDTFEKEAAKAEEFAEKKKDKAKETAQGVFNAFTDPEVQKHLMAMGLEFMMTVNALISAMPLPDTVKDMAEKAKEARKSAAEDHSKTNAEQSKGAKSSAPEKIKIEPVPKKKATPKAKTSSKDEE